MLAAFFLLVATNLAILLMLTIVARLLGLDRWLAASGSRFGTLLAFAVLFGFGGAFISLLLSKWIARRSMGVVSAPDQALAAEAHAQAHYFIVDLRRPALNELGALFANGALQANMGEILPLAQAPLAHEMLAGRAHRRGKIVLDIDSRM